VTTLVLLTTSAPAKLSDELMMSGYRVFEALAVSEVQFLIETENINAVIITADVDDRPGIREIQSQRLTIKLTPAATTEGLIWELSHLFRTGKTPVQ
jgi:hypothetical protein